MGKLTIAALSLLAGCSHSNVPGLDGDDTVVQNLPCLFICISTISAADTDSTGSGSNTVSQTQTTGSGSRTIK